MPAGDLCTLADVQTFLGNTAPGSMGEIRALISQVSAWVQSYCERRFDGVQTLTWLTDGLGGDTLPLPEGPVTGVISVMVDGTLVPASSGQTYGWIADERSVSIIGGAFSRGRKNVRIVYTAGYPYLFTDGTSGAPDTITGIPFEIQFATVETVALRFKRKGSLGKNSDGLAGQSTTYDNAMAPKDAMASFNRYRKNTPW